MTSSLVMLEKIVREAASASSAEKQMNYIVSAVRTAMMVSVCSLYVVDTETNLTLIASDGLDPASIGKVKLSTGEGLVGGIAFSNHPLNLDNAAQHNDYIYFPETGEEQYQAFLGVPLVHLRQTVGVLVVQERQQRKFTSDEEAFLVTIAAHLAATISTERHLFAFDQETTKGQRVFGIKGAPGIGVGIIHRLTGEPLEKVVDRECEDITKELNKFHSALRECHNELEQESQSLEAELPGNISSIFSVYRMLLESNELTHGVELGIRGGNWASGALRATISEYASRFESMDDPYLRSRAEDVRNIGNKIYAKLSGQANIVSPSHNLILTGNLVSITDIARYKRHQLAGIICESGSSLSHTAILANALGLPAVMGTGEIKNLHQGTSAILDGHLGQVILNPSTAVQAEFKSLANRERHLIEDLEALKELPAVTPDGQRIKLYANTGLLTDISPGLKFGAEGIGLYRTEFLFMEHENFPTEDEQVKSYHHVLSAYAGKPVTIRTLDVGGDKVLPYYRFSEENPYLGWRGVRFSLDNRPIFMTQIRAMLRASEGLNNLQVLLPMVSRVDELDAFTALLGEACTQLQSEGYQLKRPPVGIMVEVPAAVNLLPFFASRVNFVSIGSNDLTQYLLAVDRNNSRVSHLFDNLHPAVLKEVHRIVLLCRTLDLQISLCGEMAADPLAAALLLGMGVESLSMSAYSLPKIKWLIRTLPVHVAEETLQKALTMEHESQIRQLTQKVLIKNNLGSLISERTLNPEVNIQ